MSLVLPPAGYAFSTYGEVAACWVQDIVLVALITRHMRTGHKRLAAAVVAFAVYCWWLVSGLCSMETLTGASPPVRLQGRFVEQQCAIPLYHVRKAGAAATSSDLQLPQLPGQLSYIGWRLWLLAALLWLPAAKQRAGTWQHFVVVFCMQCCKRRQFRWWRWAGACRRSC